MWGRICAISPSRLTSWVSKQSLWIFTSFSLTIHITHVIQTHVAFNDSFTNQVFVTFNEHCFTPGTRTICRTDVCYFSTAAASVWTEDSKRCYFVRGGYIFNTNRPSKSWRCKRSGWKKTVTVLDSLGGNVINCKWTGAWYFKMQPKQHFEILTLLSALSTNGNLFCWLSIKKLFIQFISRKTKHFSFNTHIFNWYQHLIEATEKHVNNKTDLSCPTLWLIFPIMDKFGPEWNIYKLRDGLT